MAKGYSAKIKFQVVTELLSGNKTAGQVAKVYGISNSKTSVKSEFRV